MQEAAHAALPPFLLLPPLSLLRCLRSSTSSPLPRARAPAKRRLCAGNPLAFLAPPRYNLTRVTRGRARNIQEHSAGMKRAFLLRASFCRASDGRVGVGAGVCAIALFSSFRRRRLSYPRRAQAAELYLASRLQRGDGEPSLIDFFCLSCLSRIARLFHGLLSLLSIDRLFRVRLISFTAFGGDERPDV